MRTGSAPDERASQAGPPSVMPRDAATIMLVRDARLDGGDVLEVCMVRRHLDSDFVGGAYVFPGGKVDDADRGSPAEAVCTGRSDAQASAMLGVPSGGLAFWVAALRECFEEAGVLLAYRSPSGADGVLDVADERVHERLAAVRRRLNAGEIGFLQACEDEGLSLAVDRVHYFSHWITPEPAPKRYDTRFFVAALPPGQVPVHDDRETVDTVWVRPADALERARAGEFDLIFPTMKNLEAIGRFSTSGQLLAAAAALEKVPTVLPRVVSDAHGFRILLPGDPGYEDAVPNAEQVSVGHRAAPDGPAAPGDPAAPTGPAGPAGPAAASGPAAPTNADGLSSAALNKVVRSIGADGRSRPRD